MGMRGSQNKIKQRQNPTLHLVQAPQADACRTVFLLRKLHDERCAADMRQETTQEGLRRMCGLSLVLIKGANVDASAGSLGRTWERVVECP